MNKRQTELKPGQIQFHQWCEPPLEPADYKLSVNQSVKQLATEGDTPKGFNSDYSFSVAGPRFTLDPLEIYSVYPPKGDIGDFANSLPHVVFTRRTLPWERSLYPATGRQEDDALPWMALLVFSASDFEGDLFPEVTSRKLDALLNPPDKDEACGPQFNVNDLAAYESRDDLCNTIDLPWDKFQQVAPSRKDLSFLSHVREVNTDDKETSSFMADGWFSVVLANRFPEPRQPFSVDDFTDPSSLVKNLKETLPLAEYLWSQFSPESIELLSTDATVQQSVLVREFNRIVRAEAGFTKTLLESFKAKQYTLSSETEKLLKGAPEGSEAIRLNRLLLEDFYPSMIAQREDFRVEDTSTFGNKPLAIENRAMLVSLEGMTGYLPGDSKDDQLVIKKSIRLAVLASWSFHCEEAFNFKASMAKLDVKRLGVPWSKAEPASASENAKSHIHNAFERGYTALNHSTRLGEKTVSWYRGPLVPFYLTKETKYKFRPAADAALRYNPIDGMMDVTYASAFQLGRLLGLHDRHFATSLYAYRSNINRQLDQKLGQQRIREELGAPSSSNDESQSEIMSAYLNKMSEGDESNNPVSLEESKDGSADSESCNGDDVFSRDPENANELRLTTDFNLTVPKAICKWLARLVLVYRVPFSYLVPDQRMLPPDSLRFFYLDPGWLKCLLEGACSVGRTSARDELVDEFLRDKFLDFAMSESQQVRTRQVDQANGDKDSIAISTEPELPNWPLTGFLMRSPVVDGWQGLEMCAWSDSDEKQPLKTLRIDRLAPDIMLCIFNGKVNRIEIKQPPEGMHFGAAPDGNGFTRFHLRWLAKNTDGDESPGDQLGDSKTEIPLRDNDTRVVQVEQLAAVLKKKLDSKNARNTNKSFTSADFGVEMVESPGRVIFDVKNPDENLL